MAFNGKNGLITGACGGLGKSIAEAFLQEGANVIVCDVRRELVDDFKENVSAAYPECTLVLECDVTKDFALDDMFAQAKQTFGQLDFVVNCAGMMDRFDPIADVERSMWDKVIALNLTAPAMIMKRAVDMMVETKVQGSIVNIASIAGIVGFTSGKDFRILLEAGGLYANSSRTGAAYTTSKHGLIGLTKNTAAFYGPKAGIRCNAILPGGMHTNIFQNLGSDLNVEGFTMMRKSYPEDLSPVVEIEKVAKMVLHLCSDAGQIMNGACITADGGTTAH